MHKSFIKCLIDPLINYGQLNSNPLQITKADGTKEIKFILSASIKKEKEKNLEFKLSQVEHSRKQSLAKVRREFAEREEEIDLVGMGESTVVLGEVRWRKEQTGMAVLKALMEKGQRFEASEKIHLLFSKNGFTKDVKDFAKKESGIILKEFLTDT